MTIEVEVLDALPGCGKTYAILRYMADRPDDKWIYLSPMRSEIRVRVQEESQAIGMEMFIAEDREEHEELHTMVYQVLGALTEGKNIACTHNLLLRLGADHVKLIQEKGYNIVCDEELDLIRGYQGLKVSNIKYLLGHGIMTINEEDGQISFKDVLDKQECDGFADARRYAALGCLYAAKKRNQFLVIQLSPLVIQASKRFILLTYGYKGSIMETFMKMRGFSFKALDGVTLHKSTAQRVREVSELITFIETPAIKKWQKNNSKLSATWWKGVSSDELDLVAKDIANVIRKSPGVQHCMLTLPKGNVTGESEEGRSKKMHHKRVDFSQMFVPYNARATNDYQARTFAIHALNLFPNAPVAAYVTDMGFVCDSERYALTTFIQWLFRGCIRNDQPMSVAILSGRTSSVFKQWLSDGGFKD